MDKALFLSKKKSRPIYLGPIDGTVYVDEIVPLEYGKMHVLGRNPEKVRVILNKNDDLSSMWEEITGEKGFNPINMPDYFSNISNAHCALYPIGNEAYLLDLDSKNGTFLNGNRIDAIAKIDISHIVKIGYQELELVMLPVYSAKRALIMAVDSEGNLKGIMNNANVMNNANAMARLLEARGFNKDDIATLTYSPQACMEKIPTLEMVVGRLEKLASIQDGNSLTFIQYYGHGLEDGSLSLPGRKMEPRLIYELVSDIPGYKVLMFDSCYSGKIKKYFEKEKLPKSTIICSAKEGQKAKGRDLGYFTRELLKMASEFTVVNPSIIAALVHMKNQDRTFCGDLINF